MTARPYSRATVGLSSAGRDQVRAAYNVNRPHTNVEQLYVRVTDEPDVARPIQLDGWWGYGSVGRLNLTNQQARDLIAILVEVV